MSFKEKMSSFFSKSKNKILASALVGLSLVGGGSAFADTPSKIPVNIVTAVSEAQKIQAENMFVALFNATVSYITTMVNLSIGFITRPDVLGVLVLLSIAYFVWGVVKRKFFRKSF